MTTDIRRLASTRIGCFRAEAIAQLTGCDVADVRAELDRMVRDGELRRLAGNPELYDRITEGSA